MSNLYWLSEDQMVRLRPYFPISQPLLTMTAMRHALSVTVQKTRTLIIRMNPSLLHA